jgi:rhodanese-related sulfurtransferase
MGPSPSSLQEDQPAVYPPSVPAVSPAGVPDGAVVLDVREQDEWEAGHIPGALHIPLGELTARAGELPAEQVVVVCRVGARSARAVAWLNRSGHDTLNLDGGMQVWAMAGRSMVSENGDQPVVR